MDWTTAYIYIVYRMKEMIVMMRYDGGFDCDCDFVEMA